MSYWDVLITGGAAIYIILKICSLTLATLAKLEIVIDWRNDNDRQKYIDSQNVEVEHKENEKLKDFFCSLSSMSKSENKESITLAIKEESKPLQNLLAKDPRLEDMTLPYSFHEGEISTDDQSRNKHKSKADVDKENKDSKAYFDSFIEKSESPSNTTIEAPRMFPEVRSASEIIAGRNPFVSKNYIESVFREELSSLRPIEGTFSLVSHVVQDLRGIQASTNVNSNLPLRDISKQISDLRCTMKQAPIKPTTTAMKPLSEPEKPKPDTLISATSSVPDPEFVDHYKLKLSDSFASWLNDTENLIQTEFSKIENDSTKVGRVASMDDSIKVKSEVVLDWLLHRELGIKIEVGTNIESSKSNLMNVQYYFWKSVKPNGGGVKKQFQKLEIVMNLVSNKKQLKSLVYYLFLSDQLYGEPCIKNNVRMILTRLWNTSHCKDLFRLYVGKLFHNYPFLMCQYKCLEAPGSHMKQLGIKSVPIYWDVLVKATGVYCILLVKSTEKRPEEAWRWLALTINYFSNRFKHSKDSDSGKYIWPCCSVIVGGFMKVFDRFIKSDDPLAPKYKKSYYTVKQSISQYLLKFSQTDNGVIFAAANGAGPNIALNQPHDTTTTPPVVSPVPDPEFVDHYKLKLSDSFASWLNDTENLIQTEFSKIENDSTKVGRVASMDDSIKVKSEVVLDWLLHRELGTRIYEDARHDSDNGLLNVQYYFWKSVKPNGGDIQKQFQKLEIVMNLVSNKKQLKSLVYYLFLSDQLYGEPCIKNNVRMILTRLWNTSHCKDLFRLYVGKLFHNYPFLMCQYKCLEAPGSHMKQLGIERVPIYWDVLVKATGVYCNLLVKSTEKRPEEAWRWLALTINYFSNRFKHSKDSDSGKYIWPCCSVIVGGFIEVFDQFIQSDDPLVPKYKKSYQALRKFLSSNILELKDSNDIDYLDFKYPKKKGNFKTFNKAMIKITSY